MSHPSLYRRARIIRVGLREDCELMGRLQYNAAGNDYTWSIWLHVCGTGVEQLERERILIDLSDAREGLFEALRKWVRMTTKLMQPLECGMILTGVSYFDAKDHH